MDKVLPYTRIDQMDDKNLKFVYQVHFTILILNYCTYNTY